VLLLDPSTGLAPDCQTQIAARVAVSARAGSSDDTLIYNAIPGSAACRIVGRCRLRRGGRGDRSGSNRNARAGADADSHAGGDGFPDPGTSGCPLLDKVNFAGAVSADGRVVVGVSASASGNQAFRWTVDGDLQALGMLPEYTGSSGMQPLGELPARLRTS